MAVRLFFDVFAEYFITILPLDGKAFLGPCRFTWVSALNRSQGAFAL